MIVQRQDCMNKHQLIIIWLFVLMLAVLYLGSKLRIVTDITQFMPDYRSVDQQYALFLDELNQGETSKILFLRLSTNSANNTAKVSQSLKHSMLKSGLFETVQNGNVELNFSDYEVLFQYRYLLSPNQSKDIFSTISLENSLSDRLNEISAGMGILLKQTIQTDPTNAFLAYLRNAKQWEGPDLKYGVWFANDNKSALLIAHISQNGFDLDTQNKAIEFIRNSVSDLSTEHPITLEITGPAAFAIAIRDKIKHTLTLLSAIGISLILLALLFVYRSVPLVILAGLPLFSAILVAIAVTNMVFGSIHGITLAFGITLLGVCIDYPVHLFSHLRMNQSPVHTLKSIWPTLRLGVLTTSLGYFALLWSGFVGLSQLAVFAIVGLVVALGLTRWFIPNWIPKQYQPHHRKGVLLQVLDNQWRVRFGQIIVVVCIGVLLYFFGSYKNAIWERDISTLSPIPEESRILDRQLRQQLGLPDVNHVFILTNKNPELLLQKVEQLDMTLQPLVKMGVVQYIYSTTDLLPSQARQRQRQAHLPDRAELEVALGNAIQHMPFKLDTFNPFIQAVQTSRNLTPLTWNDMQATPLAELINADFFNRRNQWVSIIRLGGVSDEAALSTWLKKHPIADNAYFNLRDTASNLLHLYQKNAATWILVGLSVMLLILLVFIKSITVALRMLIAPVLAVIISLGTQVLMGIQLNLFHLLSVLLIIGIGIDYSLFFNRVASDRYDWQQSFHGVMVSALTTIVAFGVLVFSKIPVLTAIGQTVALGVFTCLVLALLLANRQKQLSS